MHVGGVDVVFRALVEGRGAIESASVLVGVAPASLSIEKRDVMAALDAA